MNLEQTLEAQREAMRAIVRGDPEPTKALYSEADDVTLANPWGPAVRGRAAACGMLDFVGTRFRDGVLEGFEQLAAYVDSNIATVFENERWSVKIGGRDELSPLDRSGLSLSPPTS